MFTDKKPGGLADGLEIERPGHVPSPTNLHGMEEGSIHNPIQVGFAPGGKASMEFRFCRMDGHDPHSGRKMEIQGSEKNAGGVGGGKPDGGDLAEGVDTTIGTTGSGHVERLAEDLFQGGLEGELDRGMGILALPPIEVGSAVGDGEFEGLGFHPVGVRPRVTDSKLEVAGRLTQGFATFVKVALPTDP